MAPNPYLAKVLAKVLSSLAKSTIKAYSTTVKKNSGVSGKKSFKFDWNDIFKHSKFNKLNYFDLSRLKTFNPFEKKSDDPAEQAMSKSNSHSISQIEALKILGIEIEQKRSINVIMEHYLFLYTKNKPENGGSAYLQAKIMNAKDMLIEEFGGLSAEKTWRETNGYQDDDNTVFERVRTQEEPSTDPAENSQADQKKSKEEAVLNSQNGAAAGQAAETEGAAAATGSEGQEGSADQQQQEQEQEPEEEIDLEEKWKFPKEDEDEIESAAAASTKKPESTKQSSDDGFDAEIAKFLENYPPPTGPDPRYPQSEDSDDEERKKIQRMIEKRAEKGPKKGK